MTPRTNGRTVLRVALALVAALLVGAVASPAAQAAPTKKGQTVVTLDSGFAQALESLQVDVGVVAPAYGKDGGVAFPIVGKRGATVVKHVGGLALSAGDTTVTLTNFWIEGTVITGVVNGDSRVPLFDLTAPGGVVTLDLTDAAAGALNDAFGIDALSGTTTVGTASVQAM